MNDQLLQVNVIPVEDSFVHLSSKLIRELNVRSNRNHSVCLKVTTVDGIPKEFYASFSQTPFNSNGDDALNISNELSSTIGLNKSQHVLITVIGQVHPLNRVYITPIADEDWDLLMLNNVTLQDSILHQLRIVQLNKIFPIWVSKFVHLKVFIDDLENNVQVGLLVESTEIVVKPNVLTSGTNNNERSINIDQDIHNCIKTNTIHQNDFIPITKYQNCFIYRTILAEKTLLKSDYIYDYCALISKSHLSILFEKKDVYSSGDSFVKISLLHELNQMKSIQDDKKKSDFKNASLVIRLCPLDPFMNNIDKMKIIIWPTIYISNSLKKMLGLKMNSKVILEPVSRFDNDICAVETIYISPIKKLKMVDEEILIKSTRKRLEDEIAHREVVILNNSSLLRVVYNKLSALDVLVTFSPSNIPYVFLNEYNFGMLTFTYKTENSSIKINELQQTEESVVYNTSNLEYFDLKCFKEFTKIGSSCLKLGLQCYTNLPQTYFAFDNLLITGSISTGKTSAAQFFCHKLSKCPYFVNIIWISGRFLAGKLWETVQKQLSNHFQSCVYYQPSVIVIDDLDDLCHLNSEPNEFADMSKIYLRQLHLLMRMIEKYTSNEYCIRVVCTVKPLNQNNENLFKKLYKNVFKTVIHIPSIDKVDKKKIISKRLNKIRSDIDVNNDFLMGICEKMDCYVIQDLIDYCDKVLFEVLQGGCNKTLNKSILTEVFEKTIPLSLHNVTLCKEKKINFSSVGGLKEAKQIITETIIWPSLHSDVFSKCPLKLQSGVLLYGAPGTGKTLLARAIAGESNLNFISISGPELLSKYVGESEENIRKIFLRAQNAKPCIIFFDEFESIAPRRGSDQTGVTDRVVNQFLTQLDGVDIFEGVWVIAATSRPDLIDPALLRPGRIGVKLHCPIPTVSCRQEILQVLSNNVSLSENINLHTIAKETINYTGADLNGLLYTAFSVAEKKSLKEQIGMSSSDFNSGCQPTITNEDFREALEVTNPSLSQAEIDQFSRIHQVFSGKKIAKDQNKVIIDGNIEMIKRKQKTTFA